MIWSVKLKWFRIGSVALIVIGLCHLAGQVLLKEPKNRTEKVLLDLMTTYQKPVAGGHISMKDVQDGLSLCYGLFFISIGVANLILVIKKAPLDLIRSISFLQIMTFGCGTVISVIYFFWLPALSFAAATACFALAAAYPKK